jgi:Domain of unknown function (DUF4286)
MYLYNVSIKITPAIREDWLLWMKDEHIGEVLATGLFVSAEFSEILEPLDEEGFTFSVRYIARNMEDYSNYIENYAPALRDKGFAKFGNQFIAFRTLMYRMENFEVKT